MKIMYLMSKIKLIICISWIVFLFCVILFCQNCVNFQEIIEMLVLEAYYFQFDCH